LADVDAVADRTRAAEPTAVSAMIPLELFFGRGRPALGGRVAQSP
jgi:hypothetical protein